MRIASHLLAASILLAATVLPVGPARAVLLGITGDDLLFPVVQYDNDGTLDYDAASDVFLVDTTPLAVQFMPGPPRLVTPDASSGRSLQIDIRVDENGALIGGAPGDDFVMVGSIDQDFPPDGNPDFEGVLLTGEIVAFGFANSATPTDVFDFRFRVTGGSLAPLFAGSDIGVLLDVEQSSFDGGFGEDFGGAAKGSIARLAPICIDIEKQISVDGGQSFFDADEPGAPDVPVVPFPSGAGYALRIENCGSVALENVVLNDPKLGLVDVPVGNGLLAPRQSVVLGMGELPELQVAEVCNASGEFICSTSVRGISTETQETVEDADPAVLRCEGDPAVQLLKQISVDAGLSWADADAAGDPDTPVVNFPADARYRLIVRNVGTVPLSGILLTDLDLGFANFPVGDLPVEGEIVVDSAQIPALDRPNRCRNAGVFTNTARVSADGGGVAVVDMDSAVLVCEGVLMLELDKQISVDGGATWADADAASDPDTPILPFPSGALYRLTVRNTGTLTVGAIVLNDAELGIVDFFVGAMPAGTQRSFDAAVIPELDVERRCENAGEFVNTARADGRAGLDLVSVSDSAVLVCVGAPKLQLLKQISVDGGLSYADADAPDDADTPRVGAPSGALYRLVVSNVGAVDLQDVTVADPDLGIPSFPVGALAVGDSVTLGPENIRGLRVEQACDVPGLFINVASATGSSGLTGEPVRDDDPAVLRCVARECSLELETTCQVAPRYEPGRKKKAARWKKSRGKRKRSSAGPSFSWRRQERSDVCRIGGIEEVRFRYVVRNASDAAVELSSVHDDVLGERLAAPRLLRPGQSLRLQASAVIGETTTHSVSATASPLPAGAACRALDQATVELRVPQGKKKTKKKRPAKKSRSRSRSKKKR